MNIEKIKKEIRTEFARSGGKAKASKMTEEQRIAHGEMMARAKKALKNKNKQSKKLSTVCYCITYKQGV